MCACVRQGEKETSCQYLSDWLLFVFIPVGVAIEHRLGHTLPHVCNYTCIYMQHTDLYDIQNHCQPQVHILVCFVFKCGCRNNGDVYPAFIAAIPVCILLCISCVQTLNCWAEGEWNYLEINGINTVHVPDQISACMSEILNCNCAEPQVERIIFWPNGGYTTAKKYYLKILSAVSFHLP